MKRFRFKFETLENVRRTKEQEALRVLGEAQNGLAIARGERANLEQSLAQSLLRRERLGEAATLPLAFRLETDFIEGTKQRIVQAQQGIVRAQKRVDKAMAQYLMARRQTRMIEVLRERAVADFKRARAKQEQKEQDDLYVMRARMAAKAEAEALAEEAESEAKRGGAA